MAYCISLQIVPTGLSLASLDYVDMTECSLLTKIPEISTNITQLTVVDTMLEEMPRLWSRLGSLHVFGCLNISEIEELPDLYGLEELPDWIKDLHGLEELQIVSCPNLVSLPELPRSLRKITLDSCESFETLISFPFDSQIKELCFPNCFQLDREAQRIITHQSSLACLPGRTVPADLDHRAKGNILTIRSDFKYYRICAVVSPKPQMKEACKLFCRIYLNGCPIEEEIVYDVYVLEKEHLFISDAFIFEKDGWLEQDNKILFEFTISSKDIDVIECGGRILPDVGSTSSDEYESLLMEAMTLMNPEYLQRKLIRMIQKKTA